MNEIFKSNLPTYEKIAFDLKEKIIGGSYSSARVLPEERNLAEQYNVSRNTIRNALDKLVQDNLIKKIRGMGNVIKQQKAVTADNIAILTYDIPYQTDFTINTLHLMEETAAGMSLYTLYMHLKDNSGSSIENIAGRLNNGTKIYGAILVGRYTPEILKMLVKKVCVPMIMLGDARSSERNDPPLISEVVGDDYHSYYNPVKYYLEKGFKRIAAIFSTQNYIWGLAQYRGYNAAYEDCGIESTSELQYFLPDSRDPKDCLESAGASLGKIITCKTAPQVLIIPDSCFSTAMEMAEIKKLKIPDDLLIVTVSGKKQTGAVPQSVTSFSDMIAEAFDLLQYESQSNGKVKQRRTVSSHFYP